MALEVMHKEGIKQRVIETVSSKPMLGKPLYDFRITLRYFGHRVYDLEGSLSEITNLFLNPKAQRDAVKVIRGEAVALGIISEDTKIVPCDEANLVANGDKTPIEVALAAFSSKKFLKCCRVLLVEEHFTRQLHMIFQVGRLGNIVDYADTPDITQWSFLKGKRYDYSLTGQATTFSHMKEIRDLGKIFIHVFIPDDQSGNSDVDVKVLEVGEHIAEVVPFMPQVSEIDQYLKAKDDMLKSKNDIIDQMRDELAEKSTALDGANIVISSFQTKGGQKSLGPVKLDFFDFAITGGFTLVSAVLGNALWPAFGWFAGATVGLIAGFAVNVKRG